MANDIDFQAAFDSFGTGSNAGNPIQAIYNIIPKYDSYQLKQLFIIKYFVAKWQLDDVQQLLDDMDRRQDNNRNLSFISSQNLKALLAAYTQSELVRGIKVNAYNDNSGSSSSGGV